ncbi:MAG: DUF5615 family PIN-like protein [Syntrophaceae bacterium]|nr:DUF5615 family PIN-like protein [Syntrophaceae bacterium]
MKFLIDMPLSPDVAGWLMKQGHDAIHAFQVGLDRSPDETILEYSRNDKRVVITADLDYPRILALMKAEGPGMILFRGGNYSDKEVIERLARALEMIPADELQNSVVVVEKMRIRRRHLPL